MNLDDLFDRQAEPVAANYGFFYEWAGTRCHISRRVCGGVKHLWRDYCAWCRENGIAEERFAFVQWLATEFHLVGGVAAGVCLHVDVEAYQEAYAAPTEVLQIARRVKVDFLKRTQANSGVARTAGRPHHPNALTDAATGLPARPEAA